MNDVYLVTGAAGHLGRTVIQDLLSQNKKIRILALPSEKNVPQGKLEMFFGDVTNKESLIPFFTFDEPTNINVIHCAGIVSITSKYNEMVHTVNVLGTKNIVDLSIEYKVNKLIYVSSVHALPEKLNKEWITEVEHFSPADVVGYYAKTKSEASSYVISAIKNGLNSNIIHPSGICGPNDYGRGNLTSLVLDYMHNHLKFGTQGGYDFVDVRDVSKGILSCIEKGRSGECYILSNEYYSVKTILDTLYELTGKTKVKIFLPYRFLKHTSIIVEYLYKLVNKPPLFTPYSIYTLNSNSNFSHEKASIELNYTARPLKESLKDTIDWLRLQNRI
jgi:dihydroflavonol-4-reductase